MEDHCREVVIRGNALSVRTRFLCLFAVLAAAVGSVQAQDRRPPVGGVGSAPDAMIFYVAHGAPGACGEGCSDWIAAEGIVQWDTHKRLFAVLDRQAGRKLPVIIHTWGESHLNVATSLGRILRERGLDASAGPTEVAACMGKSEPECFALKRPGGPLDAAVNTSAARCDLACVLILSGGIHRRLPAGTKIVLGGMQIANRLGLNVSEERREGLSVKFGDQFRLYLRDMGIDPQLLGVVDDNSEHSRQTELPPSDWQRLRLVNAPFL